MLARTSTIIHPSGRMINTPLLVPSFSSRGFSIWEDGSSEIEDILTMAAELLEAPYLISAYDIFYHYLPQPHDLPVKPALIVLDSGGYEISDAQDLSAVSRLIATPKLWDLDSLKFVLDTWPDSIPAMFVSYDHPDERKPFLEQVRVARRLFKGREKQLHDFLMKPESKEESTLEQVLRQAKANVEELASFDAIGVTEKELGTSMLDRMVQLATLRQALDRARLQMPIHVFGSLDPISSCLYFLAGAEIFDGLSWLRYGYLEGQCVYQQNLFALQYELDCPDSACRMRMMVNNYFQITGLQRCLRDFVSTGDFLKLGPCADLISKAHDSLQTELEGGA